MLLKRGHSELLSLLSRHNISSLISMRGLEDRRSVIKSILSLSIEQRGACLLLKLMLTNHGHHRLLRLRHSIQRVLRHLSGGCLNLIGDLRLLCLRSENVFDELVVLQGVLRLLILLVDAALALLRLLLLLLLLLQL